ncbi:MAG: rubredoxin [Nanoarchaeota archaeon]|nr:rubredoxin [Nanoarchaeota archaeon]
MAKWECLICGYIYDEVEGDSDSGIDAGTKFEDIADDWACPECGAIKGDPENWRKLIEE